MQKWASAAKNSQSLSGKWLLRVEEAASSIDEIRHELKARDISGPTLESTTRISQYSIGLHACTIARTSQTGEGHPLLVASKGEVPSGEDRMQDVLRTKDLLGASRIVCRRDQVARLTTCLGAIYTIFKMKLSLSNLRNMVKGNSK